MNTHLTCQGQEFFGVQNSDFASTSNQEHPDPATGNMEGTQETCETNQQGQNNNIVPSSTQEDADLSTGKVEFLFLLEVAILICLHLTCRFLLCLFFKGLKVHH